MNVLFYFLHVILCPEHTILAKKKSLIAHFAIVAEVFSDLALLHQHIWSVTSREH